MADDGFEGLILASMGTGAGVHEEARKVASERIKQFLATSDAWKTCLQKLLQIGTVEKRDEVRFWCLDAVYNYLGTSYGKLSDADRSLLRSSVLSFLTEACVARPQASYVKGKLASLIVRMIFYEYPERWPSVFNDLIALLDKGEEVVNIFLRTLRALVQDVVGHADTANASPQERERNRQIKDAMRVQCVPHLMVTIQKIVVAYVSRNVDLADLALQTLGDYINWVDIELIVNDNSLGLLYQSLNVPALQTAACRCLSEIVCKGIADRKKKLTVLSSIRVLEVLSQVRIEKEEFAMAVCTLAETFGNELSEVMRPITAPPSTVPQEANKPRRAAPAKILPPPEIMAEAAALLQRLTDIGFRFFEHKSFRVAEIVVPLMLRYVQFLKGLPAGSHTAQQLTSFRRIFVVSLHAIQYGDWYRFQADDTDRDAEEAFDDFRRLVFTLFKNQVLCLPNVMFELVGKSLVSVLTNLKAASFAQVEASVQLFYLLGEAVRGATRKLHEEPWRSLVGGVLQSELSTFNHPQVSALYFKLVVRYAPFFNTAPELLPPVLASFMDKRGLCHGEKEVRQKAAYDLLQLVKLIIQLEHGRKALVPHIGDILRGLQSFVQTTLARPFTLSPKAPLSSESCMHLSEVMGLLMTRQVVGEKSKEFSTAALMFFKRSLDAGLEAKESWAREEKTAKVAVKRIAYLLDGLDHLIKPLGHDAKLAVEALGGTAESVVRVYLLLPTSESVRGKTINFLHHMVDCLGEGSIQIIAAVLSSLVDHSTPGNITLFLPLITKLCVKIKGPFAPTLEAAFLPIAQKVAECLQHFAHVDSAAPEVEAAYSQDRIVRQDIHRKYHMLLKDIAANDLAGIFASPRNAPQLPKVLDSLIKGILGNDLEVCKVSVNTVKFLGDFWHRQGGGKVDGSLLSFLLQQVTAAGFQRMLNPNFSFDDASCDSYAREVVDYQSATLKLFGMDYINLLGTLMVQTLGCSPDAASQYCKALLEGVQNKLAAVVKSLRHAMEPLKARARS